MNISFFQKDGKFDMSSIGMGVYIIELTKKGSEKRIRLYIGESVWMLVRCAGHLYRVWNNPEYFGFKQDDLDNSEFELVFRVLKSVDKKSELTSVENEKIISLKPLTQKQEYDSGRGKRDSMINNEEKFKRVQKAIQQLG